MARKPVPADEDIGGTINADVGVGATFKSAIGYFSHPPIPCLFENFGL